jgi:hypothetical protein
MLKDFEQEISGMEATDEFYPGTATYTQIFGTSQYADLLETHDKR